MVTFRQGNLFPYCFLDVFYHTVQVTSGNIGRNNDFPLHVFPADGVRTYQGKDFSHVVKWNFLPVGVNHQITDLFHVSLVIIMYFYGEVEHFTAFVHL